MNHIKRNLFLLVLLASSSFCFAKQISFQVVQDCNGFDKVMEESLVVEDVLIDSFFNNGHIATNSKTSAVVSEEDKSVLWKIGVKEASEGGSEYFIQVILNFSEADSVIINKKIMVLESVDYSVHLVDNLTEKARGTLNCNLKINDSKDLSVISRKLADEILSIIKA